jgi:hypothetical protein
MQSLRGQERCGPLFFLSMALSFAAPAAGASTLLANGGFEDGTLGGWAFIGDVSVQGAGIGEGPAEGQFQALLTTLCDTRLPGADCAVTNNELPYSGSNAVPATASLFADPEFPYENNPLFELAGIVPPVDLFSFLSDLGAPAGEGSAISRVFSVSAAASLAFDYNYLSMEGGIGSDPAFLMLRGLAPESTFRLVAQLNTGTPSLSNVRLCERVEFPDGDGGTGNICPEFSGLETQTWQTGFRTFNALLPEAGDYQLGIVIFELSEGTIPSGILVDNLRVTAVPVPAAVWLLVTGVGLLAWLRRWRQG